MPNLKEWFHLSKSGTTSLNKMGDSDFLFWYVKKCQVVVSNIFFSPRPLGEDEPMLTNLFFWNKNLWTNHHLVVAYKLTIYKLQT